MTIPDPSSNSTASRRGVEPIRAAVALAKHRIRRQAALEYATTAMIISAAAALLSVFAVRIEAVTPLTGAIFLAGCAALVGVAALLGATRPLDDEGIARQLDRNANLADRLSTALAFDRQLTENPVDNDSAEFMAAAIRDGIRAAPRANPIAATPYRWPRDVRPALGFLVVATLAAGLRIHIPDRTARLLSIDPDHAPPGATIHGTGTHLLTGASPTATPSGVPSNISVYLAPSSKEHAAGTPVLVTTWTATAFTVELPGNAPVGDATLTAFIGDHALAPLAVTIVDPKDERFHKENTVALNDDDLAYAKQLLAEVKATARTDDVKALDDFTAKIEKLLDDAEKGQITKEQLLDQLAAAEKELNAGNEPDQNAVDKSMADTGKELEKNEVTKDLGKALADGDLDKAKKELDKLADKLDKEELTPQQQEQVGKAMEAAAKQFDKQQDKQDKQDQDQQAKAKEEIRRLEKKKDEAKTEPEKQDLERRLDKQKRELEKLTKDQQQKQESTERRALKRLNRDMAKAAEDLQHKPGDKKPDDKQPGEKPGGKDGDKGQGKEKQEESGNNQQGGKDGEKQSSSKQASRKIKEAAEETGRVDQDRRKQSSQKKVASQMDDLREAMRRAKQKGSKGAKDPFGRGGKNQDFAKRSRGQQGSGQAWKPSPGQGKPGSTGQGGQPGGEGKDGQGKDGQGGQGDKPGGNEAGVGHDPNLTGDSTEMGGHTVDKDISGIHGKGPSRRETILAAAQKGFASTSYEKVYADYKRVVEEVMRTEKVPSSYKFFVKRYFAKIKPN